jgi:hypothetical protein
MTLWSSHRNDENPKKKHFIIFTRAPRIRAPPWHGGAVCVFFLKYQSLIRRGGVPSGAAAHIIFGGMGVLTPIINSGMKRFSREIIVYQP